jgi:hypothetical protein
VTAAVSTDAHDHQRWFEGSLCHPAGGKTIDLITVPHAANEESMGDLAEQYLLCVSVEAHGMGALDEI